MQETDWPVLLGVRSYISWSVIELFQHDFSRFMHDLRQSEVNGKRGFKVL